MVERLEYVFVQVFLVMTFCVLGIGGIFCYHDGIQGRTISLGCKSCEITLTRYCMFRRCDMNEHEDQETCYDHDVFMYWCNTNLCNWAIHL